MKHRRRWMPIGASMTIIGASLTVPSASASDLSDTVHSMQDIQNQVLLEPDTYEGLYYSSDTNTIHIQAAEAHFSKAYTRYRNIHSTKFGPTRAGQQKVAAVEVDPVQYSRTDLNQTISSIRTAEPWASITRETLATWGIDDANDKVQVGVTHLSKEVREAAAKAFGNKVELVQQSRDTSAIKLTPVKGNLKIVHVPVRPDSNKTLLTSPAASSTAGPPLLDSEPYIGGDRIWREVFPAGQDFIQECTVAGEWDNGGYAMATAGHCQALNHSWNQGYFDQNSGIVYQSGGMGVVFDNAFIEGGSDSELLDSGGYQKSVWSTISGSLHGEPVGGVANAIQGQHVCVGGSFSGTQCSGVVTIADECSIVVGPNPDTGVISSPTACNQTRLNSSSARLVQPGDSGGPAYLDLGTTGVALTGVISAENDNGNTGIYANRIGMQAHYVGDFGHN